MPPAPAARNVLVIEDDLSTRELYCAALKGGGYVVASVGEGLAGLRFIETGRPDAIVLDMSLPRLSGRDVLRELRANPATRDIPIIIVTGTDVSDVAEGAGIPVLKKPIDPEVFVHAVEAAVRRART